MPTASSRLFMRPITMGAMTVERRLTFYVGLNKVGTAKTARLIREHGGNVVAHPGPEDSDIIPLIDPQSKTRDNSRTAFSVAYIAECVRQNKLLALEDFRVRPTTKPGPKTFLKRLKATKPREPNVEAVVAHTASPNKGKMPLDTEARGEPGLDNESVHIAKVEVVNQQRENPLVSNEKSKQTTPRRTPEKRGHLTSRVENKASLPMEQAKARNIATSLEKWTPFEDRIVMEAYEDVVSIYKRRKEDTSQAKSLACWVAMSNVGVLPPARTPEQCLERLLELKKSREVLREKRASEQDASPGLPEPAPPATDSDENFTPARGVHHHHQTLTSKRQSSGAHASSASPPLKPSGGNVRKNRRGNNMQKTKERICRIVAALAVRGDVSEKTAFFTLKREDGNWQKALKTIFRNKRRGVEHH